MFKEFSFFEYNDILRQYYTAPSILETSQIFLRDPSFYQNYLAVSNTADVTGGIPIAVWSQSISGVSAINFLVAFYNIYGWKREVLFFYFVPDTFKTFKIDF
jgi:hypothetical protein